MTEQETAQIRAALTPSRRTLDDYLEYGVQAVAALATIYFVAHFLAWVAS